MRLIGHLAEESAAKTFSDFLYVQGIENQIEHEKNLGWAVWIRDEDRIPTAMNLLAEFRSNPADKRFQGRSQSAADLRATEAADQAAYEKKLRNRRHLFRPLTPYGFGPLTFALIAACVIVFCLMDFGGSPGSVRPLYITDISPEGEWSAGLSEVRHGQIWRIFTPILIHFGPLHIIFNMLWLRDLGSMIEGRQSALHLAALVLVTAALSNLCQFFFEHTPLFGGMSGVVYGLLGYVWVRGKMDPGSGLFVTRSTVTMMLIWLVLCYTGILGHIANTAHLVGLGVGVCWGFLSSWRYR
jgi:GlpG protein